MRLIDPLMIEIDGFEIAILIEPGEPGVGHAQLLALVDVGGAPVHVEEKAQGLGGPGAKLLGGGVTPAGDHARLVVVVEVEAGPARLGHGLLLPTHGILEPACQEGTDVPLTSIGVDTGLGEEEEHIQFAIVRVGDGTASLGRKVRGFTHGQVALAPLEDLPAHLLQVLIQPGTVHAERHRRGISLRTHRPVLNGRPLFARQKTLVVDQFGDHDNHVHAETVDTPVHPPVHHPVDGLTHLRVLPVQVGLLLRELVEEVLTAVRVVLPGGAAEIRPPPVGFRARGARFMTGPGRAPPVPVGMRVVGIARGLEPGVLVGGVVDDQVHDHLDSPAMGLVQKLIHIVHGAEDGVDVLIVGDVVPVVILRGSVDGAEPDHIHAQVGQVIQTLGDARQVAVAVTVGVLEGSRVDLVDHGIGPPGVGGGPVGPYCIG